MPNAPSPADADDPAVEKADLRTRILRCRDALNDLKRRRASRRVVDNLLGLELPTHSEVSAFLPIRSEVDIAGVLEPLYARVHGLSLPAVVSGTRIVFRRYRPGDPLVPAGFGTRAPSADAEPVDPDVLLIPLSVFDRSGGRIGYGAGHYDRALERLGRLKPVLKVGCAFDAQEVRRVPMGPHDQRMDFIVTESGTVDCRSGPVRTSR